MPAIALIAAANSVNSAAIINGQVKSKDLAKGAVRTKKIAKRTVKSGKIAKNAVGSYHIKDGAVTAAKINSAGLNADTVDGKHASAFLASDANIADSKISYSTKTKYLAIPASAFRPEKDDDEFDTDYSAGWLYAKTAGDSEVYFFAPVHLPNGAEVTSLRLNVWDNHAHNSDAYLIRLGDSGDFGTLVAINSTGIDNSWRNFDNNIVNQSRKTINNVSYSYFVRVKLSGVANDRLGLNRVRITYTIAEP